MTGLDIFLHGIGGTGPFHPSYQKRQLATHCPSFYKIKFALWARRGVNRLCLYYILFVLLYHKEEHKFIPNHKSFPLTIIELFGGEKKIMELANRKVPLSMVFDTEKRWHLKHKFHGIYSNPNKIMSKYVTAAIGYKILVLFRTFLKVTLWANGTHYGASGGITWRPIMRIMG
jgi:hypothetical protein